MCRGVGCLRLGGPVDGFDGADEEGPEEDAEEAEGGSDGEGGEEGAGTLKDEAGERWSDYACEVGNAILRAVPFADGLLAGNSLRESEDAGRGGAAADSS